MTTNKKFIEIKILALSKNKVLAQETKTNDYLFFNEKIFESEIELNKVYNICIDIEDYHVALLFAS
jgi:hypothetical protein